MKAFRSTLSNIFYRTNMMFSLRIVLSLIGTTFIPFYYHDVKAIIPLTLGVVAAASTEFDAAPIAKLRYLLLLFICFALAAFSVQYLYDYPLFFLLGLIGSSFIFTLLGSLGIRYGVIAFGSLMIAAYTMIAHSIYDDWYSLPLHLLGGAFIYCSISFIELILFPSRTLESQLANSFFKLSKLLEAKATLFDPDEENGFKSQMQQNSQINDELVEALNQTRNIIFSHLSQHKENQKMRKWLNYYFILQDIHERINANYVSYVNLSRQFKYSDILFRFARILNLQAKACREIGYSIQFKRHYDHDPIFERNFSYLEASLEQEKNSYFTRSLINLFINLKNINLLLSNLNNEETISQQYVQHQIVSDYLSGLKDAFFRIKQNLTLKSALFRHAIRISVVFAVGYGIILLTDLPHGYWIILTSLFVCQPNYSTTRYRLRLRVIGTIAGIILGIPLLYLLPNQSAQLVFIILSGWLFFLFKQSQYAYATAFITLLVFFSFGLVGESSWMVAQSRLIATLIGCFIAWCAVSYIWPDWKFRNIRKLVQRCCEDDCHYLALIGYQYQTGKTNDANYRIIRRAVHENNADFTALLSLMKKEPNVNEERLNQAFRFITLNYTLVGYLSTLGANRGSELTDAILTLFDDSSVHIINVIHEQDILNNDLVNEVKLMIETVTEQTGCDYLVLQQLFLIFELLPELIQIKKELIDTTK